MAALLRPLGLDDHRPARPEMVGLVPELAQFVPPARTFDKHVYSPWTGTDLHQQLRRAGVETIIITGGETDVCVLATMLGAIDWGFRTILVTDALCSSADKTHDAMMDVYMNRFAQQVECVTTETILDSWPGAAAGRAVVMSAVHLVQILLPKETGNGEPISQDWFEGLLKELTGKFGGATSFVRAPAQGLWRSGGETGARQYRGRRGDDGPARA